MYLYQTLPKFQLQTQKNGEALTKGVDAMASHDQLKYVGLVPEALFPF
jgi:hypothetical protein